MAELFMGRIQDRTKEHLGKSDVGISLYRRMLRAAIASVKEGSTDALPMLNGCDADTVFGPISNDTIGNTDNWEEDFKINDNERRAACADWNASVEP